TPPTPRPHPPPPPEASPSRRRRRSTFADEYFNPEAEDYHFDPRDRPRWNMVQWGVTLVLLPLILYMGTYALAFSSLFVGMGTGLALGGAVLISGIMAVVCDVLRLVGYALCLNTPGKFNNRLWVIIALIRSVSAGVVLVVPIAIAEAVDEPAVILGLYGGGMTVAMCGWGAYLMYLEGVAEMFNERGIADSVSAIIK